MDMQLSKSILPRGVSPLGVQFVEATAEMGRTMVLLNRFHPESLQGNDISALRDYLSAHEQQRASYKFNYLHVSVDGEEVAVFLPQNTACEPFKIPTTASFIEVTGEDHDGDVLLAAFSLTHLDPCWRSEPYRASIPCGENQIISITVSPLGEEEEPTYWGVQLECSFVSFTTESKRREYIELSAISDADHLEPRCFLKDKLLLQPTANPHVRIVVVGIGGSGSNTVDKLIEAGVQGVTFAAFNTDLQALQRARAPIKVQLGPKLTCGLGAGAKADIGRAAALESTEKIIEILEGADMVFITTGLGGGTGTGAAPVVAGLAQELSALTLAAVATPFAFEGRHRMQEAREGSRLLYECTDTVITLPNERLLYTLPKSVSLNQAFAASDDVLRQSVQSILDLVAIPGLINLDFADIRAVMANMGSAFFGTGRASGEMRAMEATQRAITSPFIEEATIEGAKGVLLNISGGPDLTLYEVNEAASIIREAVDEDANIIFGAVVDELLRDEMRVTVIATGYQHTLGKDRCSTRADSSIVPKHVCGGSNREIVPNRETMYPLVIRKYG